MIVWSLVLKRLNQHLKDIGEYNALFDGLYSVLLYFYSTKKLSIQQIADLTGGECSSGSLRFKLKELGIKLRRKGGPNYIKPFTISKEEYERSTYKELALKYKVDQSTISRRCKKFVETGGKKKKIKDLHFL